MKRRTIYHVFDASREQVGNMNIRRALPVQGLKELSPYLLIDHMGPKHFEAGDSFEVPPHPHAGFQTVTYFLKGSGFHRDSLGNSQVIEPGDVNWMTAGRGIVHGEYSSEQFNKTGGEIHGFQIWVNLPGGERDIEPDFGNYQSSELPEIEGDKWLLKIVAGAYGGQKSPVKTFSSLHYFHLSMEEGAVFQMNEADEQNQMLYLAEGKLLINGEKEVSAGQLVVFNKDGEGFEAQALEGTHALILGGEPLGHQYVSYGPFIANNVRHLQEQIRRYEKGEMGSLL